MADASDPQDPSPGAHPVSTRLARDDGRWHVTVQVAIDPDRGSAPRDSGPREAPPQEHGAPEDAKNGGDHDGDSGGHDDDAGKDGQEHGKPPRKPLYKRPAIVGLILLAVLILICVAIVWWRHAQQHESTDDAFIDGHVSTVAPQASGRVLRLYVLDNQHVNANQPLLDIDARDYQVKVDQAEAQLANAQSQLIQAQARVVAQQADAQQAAASVRQIDASLAKAELDLRRYRRVDPQAVPAQQADAAATNVRSLRAQRDASQQAVDAARAQIKAAQAQVRTAEAGIKVAQANLDAARLQLSYTHVVAPIAGRITRRTVEVGNFVNAGQPLLSIVSDDEWVTANYKETQLSRMHTGQRVDIKIDAYPGVTFRGKVDSVQAGTGSFFSMLPAENATGNYVKVVQRVPVKIVFDDDRIRNYLLAPGMSVVPDVRFSD